MRRVSTRTSGAKVSRTITAKLAKLGVHREFDLVLHLPLRYEDETRLTPIGEAAQGTPLQVEGTVKSTEIVYRPKRQLLSRIQDASGELILRFFNFYGSQAKALAPGATVRAFGEVRTGFFGGEMAHPRFRVLREETPLPTALTPIYPTTAGLSQAALRRFTFKIKFMPLMHAQREQMFVTEALGGDAERFEAPLRERLGKLTQLCPGDFAAVKRQVDILASEFSSEEFLAQLEAEHRIKPEVREGRAMGFMQ